MRYGVDVGAQRADDLDKLLLAAVAEKVAVGHTPTILDIGCATGGLAKRLAAAGAMVTAIDVEDYSKAFLAPNQSESSAGASIVYQQSEAQMFVTECCNQGEQYDYVVLQRVLHYLPQTVARQLLRDLTTITKDALYVAVTGAESDIGKAHTAIDTPLEARHALLEPEARTTFYIHEPITPYTRTEFETLLASTGWEIEKVWTSAFYNHKAVTKPCR